VGAPQVLRRQGGQGGRAGHSAAAAGQAQKASPAQETAAQRGGVSHLPRIVCQQRSVQGAVQPVPREQQEGCERRLAAVLWQLRTRTQQAGSLDAPLFKGCCSTAS
jgi:hypothetical protein